MTTTSTSTDTNTHTHPDNDTRRSGTGAAETCGRTDCWWDPRIAGWTCGRTHALRRTRPVGS